MSVRKRTAEEQAKYDEIEAHKRLLRDAKEHRDRKRDVLLACTFDISDAALTSIAGQFFSARDRVSTLEAQLGVMEDAYRKMRLGIVT